MTSLMTPPNAA